MSASLIVNGHAYGGWKSVRVTRGIEQMAGAFELEVTDRWPADGKLRDWPIRAGDACRVELDGRPAINGYVDAVEVGLDEGSHSVRVSGRDRTADLVDCSAVHAGQWSGRRLSAIARELARPFGIEVVVAADGALPSFALQEGETVFEALERAARQVGVLPTSDPEGRLLLTRAGTDRVPVELAQGNILRANGTFRVNERFSQITVKGQGRGEGEGQAKTQATDSEIVRYRPLVVIAEEQQGAQAGLQRRAEWERSVRAGRGSRAEVTVQGWSHPGGLWLPNHRVRVDAPVIRTQAELLIVACTYVLDGNGSRTELSLADPRAFDLITGVAGTRLDRAIKGRDGAAIAVKDGFKDKKRWKR